MNKLCVVFAVLALGACQQSHRAASRPARASTATATPSGTFDNHEQVWRAREEKASAAQPPHVVVTLEATRQAEWTLWHVQLDATPVLGATWALRSVAQADGSIAIVPYRALVATPAPAAAFDEREWTVLDACTLRAIASAPGGLHADAAACAAIAPGIGAAAALLPLGIEQEGEWLHVRLYADQARGADAREDARRVYSFGGWAAINGGAPKAEAVVDDWHMNRTVRLGSEGGQYALKWRDGSASGYALALERLTYREGNVPVLKLSVVDTSSGRTLAYSWTNPEATAIGINLGWVQVGLKREEAASAQ